MVLELCIGMHIRNMERLPHSPDSIRAIVLIGFSLNCQKFYMGELYFSKWLRLESNATEHRQYHRVMRRRLDVRYYVTFRLLSTIQWVDHGTH